MTFIGPIPWGHSGVGMHVDTTASILVAVTVSRHHCAVCRQHKDGGREGSAAAEVGRSSAGVDNTQVAQRREHDEFVERGAGRWIVVVELAAAVDVQRKAASAAASAVRRADLQVPRGGVQRRHPATSSPGQRPVVGRRRQSHVAARQPRDHQRLVTAPAFMLTSAGAVLRGGGAESHAPRPLDITFPHCSPPKRVLFSVVCHLG